MVPSAPFGCPSKLFWKGTVKLKVFWEVLCVVSGLSSGARGSPFSVSCAFHGFAGGRRKAPHRSVHCTHWVKQKWINSWKHQIRVLSIFFSRFWRLWPQSPMSAEPKESKPHRASGSILLCFFPFEDIFYAFFFLHSEQNSTLKTHLQLRRFSNQKQIKNEWPKLPFKWYSKQIRETFECHFEDLFWKIIAHK